MLSVHQWKLFVEQPILTFKDKESLTLTDAPGESCVASFVQAVGNVKTCTEKSCATSEDSHGAHTSLAVGETDTDPETKK